MKPSPTPESQLNAFIAEYSPEIAAQAHAVLARMRKLVPGAIQLVYDRGCCLLRHCNIRSESVAWLDFDRYVI